MKKLIVGVIVVSALFFLGGCAADGQVSSAERDEAVTKAQAFFTDLKNKGFNFTGGPCISNNLLGDEVGLWVVDVVSVPRSAEDDLAENQCSRYRSGDATHFVELDMEGSLVRAL